MDCKNCDAELIGKYCHACGQKDYTSKDKKIGSILEEAFHFMTHFEGTFFTTLKTVILYPGKLSLDYCNGIRKRYYKPISFFMLLIVIYLLFPMMEGLNMQLHHYKHLVFSGGLIKEQIIEKAQQLNVTEAELAEIFHNKSEKVSKILLFILIPLTVGGLYLLPPYKKRKPLYDLFILSTELNTMILLLVFLIMPVLYFGVLAITQIKDDNDGMFPFVTILVLAYMTVTFRRFYNDKWGVSILKAILFLFLYAIISQVIYKFILFEVVYLML